MKEFGGKAVFRSGGCDMQKVLPLSTPEEVREHVGMPKPFFFNARRSQLSLEESDGPIFWRL